jgi:hypothetical protein
MLFVINNIKFISVGIELPSYNLFESTILEGTGGNKIIPDPIQNIIRSPDFPSGTIFGYRYAPVPLSDNLQSYEHKGHTDGGVQLHSGQVLPYG